MIPLVLIALYLGAGAVLAWLFRRPICIQAMGGVHNWDDPDLADGFAATFWFLAAVVMWPLIGIAWSLGTVGRLLLEAGNGKERL